MKEVEIKVGGAVGRVCIFSFAMKTLLLSAVLLGGSVQLVHAGQQAATIRHITVTRDDQDLGIEIIATKPVRPQAQTVTDPDRLIVDLPDARPGPGLKKISINRGTLKGVRVGLLSAKPPITRVVLDLTAPTEYQVSPFANTIVVKLGKESVSAPAPIAPTTNPPADARPDEATTAVPTSSDTQRSEPSRVRWILPILVMATVMAMLIIAVVAYLQNKRSGRGL